MPVDQRFFQIVDGMTAHALAARLGALIHGAPADQIITGVAPLALAAKGDVTYQTAGLSTDDVPGRNCIIITTAEMAVVATHVTVKQSALRSFQQSTMQCYQLLSMITSVTTTKLC